MKDITNRIIQKSKAGLVSDDDVADLERLRDEWDATRACFPAPLDTVSRILPRIS